MAQLITADVLSDIPAHEDKLDFEPYAKTVRDIILNPNVATPLTIGIFGSWGSGKSSLMRMIDERLKPEIEYTIWFNAWVYNKEDALWRALITQVLHGVERLYGSEDGVHEEVESVLEQLYQATELTDLGSLSISAANLLDEKGTGSAQFSLTLMRGLKLLDNVHSISGSNENNAEDNGQENGISVDPLKLRELRSQVRRQMASLERGRITSLEEFRQQFSSLIEKYFGNTGTPLVVFVDDLDRCLPEKAVEVLEAIKLFLDAPGCIFILAIDQDVVERGIKLRYGELGIDTKKEEEEGNGIGIDGRRYLEKIIQIPFNLPPISRESIARFIAQEAPNLPNPECGQVFAVGLDPNPRQVKRSINIFSLLWSLSRHKSEVSNLVSEVRLAKLVVLQQRFHILYATLPDSPGQIIEWEKAFREIQKNNAHDPFNWRGLLEAKLGDPEVADPPIHLIRSLNIELDDLVVLAELLTMYPDTTQYQEWNFSGLGEDQIKPYIFLTSTSSTTGTTAGTASSAQGAVTTPLPIATEDKPGAKGFDVEQPEDREDADGQPSHIVTIETGLNSRRRAYILESTFGELTRFSTFANVDADRGRGIMQNLAEVGGRFFDQVFGAYDKRENLAKLLVNATTLNISSGADESQIPWEIVYDQLPADTFARKGTSNIDDADLHQNGFWGFRYIIERTPVSPYPLKPPFENRVVDKPLIVVGLDLDSLNQDLVERLFGELEENGKIFIHQVFNPENLFSETNSLPQLAVLHGRAGIDGEEAWIDFTSTDTSVENSRELFKLLNDHFDLNELGSLTFDLGIKYENLGGDTKSAKARELISYMERRGRLNELVDIIRKSRPNITFARPSIRLNRQVLERQKPKNPGNSLLYLNVDAGIGRSTDWNHWLEPLKGLGFSGVIVPLIPPHPSWSVDFMMQFMDIYLEGNIGASEALRNARNKFYEDTGNPLGLAFAYFGPPDLQLKFDPAV